MARTKKAGILGFLACVTVWHTGCVGALSSGMSNNGAYYVDWGTRVEVGHQTTRSEARSQTDTTISITGPAEAPTPPDPADGQSAFVAPGDGSGLSAVPEEWARAVDRNNEVQNRRLAAIEAKLGSK